MGPTTCEMNLLGSASPTSLSDNLLDNYPDEKAIRTVVDTTNTSKGRENDDSSKDDSDTEFRLVQNCGCEDSTVKRRNLNSNAPDSSWTKSSKTKHEAIEVDLQNKNTDLTMLLRKTTTSFEKEVIKQEAKTFQKALDVYLRAPRPIRKSLCVETARLDRKAAHTYDPPQQFSGQWALPFSLWIW
ncbi:hypothetical protein TSTA_034790 [Talaromyces stipitatus ATCC 10500]|uniref:Uncharacterized protein n=1 Tax=Talaromyces stipitatus (strain ATCC 10500 / CBS 375.48 / QM 6759 / NRRL 1006) TaxID=441959 RepID=B8M724_TALSN|nr:uncharacterized protein TSTA_034790 [Talaromyces stipitatus ATCC 10500]EED20244.1 hypothetical protein TSTA_034790 [Talaromyces stipitatus ATCC 10500]